MQDARGASLSDADTQPPAPAAPRRIGTLLTVALAVWALDQVTKIVAMHQLRDRSPVELAGGLLKLRLVRNPGAAFGVASGTTWIFSVVAVVVIVAILRTAPRLRSAGWAVGLGLVLGGAIGNLTDRIVRDPGVFRGHVVDFLELPHWPVFNVADSAICVAAALIVLLTLRGQALDGTRATGPAPRALDEKDGTPPGE